MELWESMKNRHQFLMKVLTFNFRKAKEVTPLPHPNDHPNA
ncbi:Uncharacterised protein [Vibrio cholerae]|nr:Uncharacterised protein [Vibrio cholerae]